jgi:hypothetical protein
MTRVPKIVLTTRQPENILDSPLGLDLRACEERIAKGEHDGLLARWEFGRRLVRCREGKQLPRGLLAVLVSKHQISRSEIEYRMQYMRLPRDVKLALDAWACRMNLWRAKDGERIKDPLIRRFRLGEGYIDAECYLIPLRSGPDDKTLTEWRRIPVSELPPAEAFAGYCSPDCLDVNGGPCDTDGAGPCQDGCNSNPPENRSTLQRYDGQADG